MTPPTDRKTADRRAADRKAADRPAANDPSADPAAGGRAAADPAHVAAATAGVRTALVGSADESLLDVIDNLLSKGVLLHGEVVLGLADVDLIYARLSVLLCAADRVLPSR